jgi:hypothetical protein
LEWQSLCQWIETIQSLRKWLSEKTHREEERQIASHRVERCGGIRPTIVNQVAPTARERRERVPLEDRGKRDDRDEQGSEKSRFLTHQNAMGFGMTIGCGAKERFRLAVNLQT